MTLDYLGSYNSFLKHMKAVDGSRFAAGDLLGYLENIHIVQPRNMAIDLLWAWDQIGIIDGPNGQYIYSFKSDKLNLG